MDVTFEAFKKKYKDELTAKREFAHQLYCAGQFSEAITYFVDIIELAQTNNQIDLNDYSKASACYYALGEHALGIKVLEDALGLAPDNQHLHCNLAILAKKTGKNDIAKQHFETVLELNPNNLPALDGLAAVYGAQKDRASVRKYGLRSLEAKDKDVCSPKQIEQLNRLFDNDLSLRAHPKPFDPNTPGRNIIAFSLWGELPRYVEAAVLNATVAPIIYPGWTCRFYCDATVPESIRQQLAEQGAQVMLMKTPPRMFAQLFWRFLVINDPQVDRFLIRDADSIVNCQERVAVDEWLSSDKHFHLMRDAHTHTELILAGLWGGIGQALPDMKAVFNAYIKQTDPERTMDQRFLRQFVWPLLKQSYICHDSQFEFGDWAPFPSVGRFPSRRWHVGMDWSVLQRKP